MCEYFSCIVTKNGKIHWCEDDSHHVTIERLGIDDFITELVKIECVPNEKGTRWKYRVDENTFPEWFERMTGIERKVKKIAKQTFKLKQEYLKVQEQAWQEYEKVQEPAWQEYLKVQEPAWQEYWKVQEPARQEYNKVQGQAWQEYTRGIKNIEGYVPVRE